MNATSQNLVSILPVSFEDQGWQVTKQALDLWEVPFYQ